MPAEQVMERAANDGTQAAATSAKPEARAVPDSCRADRAEDTFSPDPDRRCDRYRLVTPYLLRL